MKFNLCTLAFNIKALYFKSNIHIIIFSWSTPVCPMSRPKDLYISHQLGMVVIVPNYQDVDTTYWKHEFWNKSNMLWELPMYEEDFKIISLIRFWFHHTDTTQHLAYLEEHLPLLATKPQCHYRKEDWSDFDPCDSKCKWTSISRAQPPCFRLNSLRTSCTCVQYKEGRMIPQHTLKLHHRKMHTSWGSLHCILRILILCALKI